MKKHIKEKQKWRKRQDEMKSLKQQGWSYGKIGAKYDISRQRVEQIIKRPAIEFVNSETT